MGLVPMKGYAWEITTKEGGWGLDEVLKSRQHVLNGIANGIDTQEWDPEHDKLIPKTYSSSNLKGTFMLCMSPSGNQKHLS